LKYTRLVKVLAIALAAVFFVPTSISMIKASEQGPQTDEATYVRIYTPGTDAQRLTSFGVEIVETYDGYVLAKVNPGQMQTLRNNALNFEEASDLFSIDLAATTFDTRDGEPAIPASLEIQAYPAGTMGDYLVQFIGPVKEEWKWQIESLGAEILRYIPSDAYLVRMTPEVRASIDALRTVTWTGIYQPVYRIDPALYGSQGLTYVEIVTLPGASINSVLAFINQQGYGKATFGWNDAGVVSYYQATSFGDIRARIDASLIPVIARMSSVEFIEPYSEPTVDNFYAQAVHQTDQDPSLIPGARKIWEMGIMGEGQIVASADTGLDYDHNMFRHSDSQITIGDIYNVTDLNRRKVIQYYPMSNYTNVDPWTEEWALKDSAIGTGPCTSGHGTATSGILDGSDDGIGASNNDGMAKAAQHFFQDIGTVGPSVNCAGGDDDLLSYIPDDLNLLFGPAYGAGARIHSNSWGGGTATYGLSSLQIDEFMWKHPDMLVVFAEGNDGGVLQHVQEQASAKNVLSAGGTFTYPSENGMTTYSSWGPTADGRIKPTLSWVSEGATSASDASPWSNANRDMEWASFGGTSYAAPDAAGHAALVRQYFTDGWYPTGTKTALNGFNPQASLLTATMVASAVKMTGQRSRPGSEDRWPNDAQGWGRPLLDDALYFQGDSRHLSVTDDTSGLKTGQWEEYTYLVNNASQNLRFIVSWTDFPGSVGVGRALVNDLDITVTAPNSDVYKGNVWGTFATGASRPNFGSYDHVNNMEGVIVNNPGVGVWTLRVLANDVPAGPQPYSIAVVGGLDIGYGRVMLDRHSYKESDTVNVRVVDLGAIGPLTVSMTSTTEPWPEDITLTETGAGTGVFAGSIQTSFGTPLPDGILEVSDGDTIWAQYTDPNPPHDSFAHATIDALKPMIYDVRVTGITSSTATITWKTNIPADSTIIYGAVLPIANVKSTSELMISHSIILVNLQTATLYFFDVQSTDARGHNTTDDNGGQHYAFKTTAKGEILLVLGDETYEQKRPEGVQAYRQSLAARGWSYNEWHVAYSGDPSLGLMQSYKAVIWQVGMEQYPPHNDFELLLLTNYLNFGGRLLYVHHDTFWAYCAVTSSWVDPVMCGQVKALLKASFNSGNPNTGDPQTLTGILGESGDPISDAYSAGPIPYVPFRAGGAADEVSSLPAGGLTTYVWSDVGGDATPDKISVRWLSSANNGSLGIGLWGGTPSKMVGYYFNWIDVDYNAGVALSAARTDVLDKTIIWLLGRDHPDVLVSAPNGGESFVTDTVTITWTASTSGSNILSQAAYYSFDNGQSWFPIAYNIPAVNTSHPWYLSASVCNGDTFLVRIEVRDDGNPNFNASDDSDGAFTVTRPGGDCAGPRLWAGSGTIHPNPVMGPVTVYINATADDTTTGNSNIDPTRPAEFFFDAAGTDGLGWGMNLTSPPTSPVEPVTWSGRLDFLSKNCHDLYIHSLDVAGHWGAFETSTFCVQNVPPTRPPRPPVLTDTALVNGRNDVRISWSLSPDDPTNLDNYEVWRSSTGYDKNKGAAYTLLGTSPVGQGFYLDGGAGADGITYFYFVKAKNVGGTASTVDQGAKAVKTLISGMNLLSIPVITSDMTLTTILAGANYDSARWYDPLDTVDHWQSYKPGRAYNDFSVATMSMGIWVHTTSAGNAKVAGKVPTGMTVQIKAGWNLVGFPSFMPYTLGQLKSQMPGNVMAFEAYNALEAPYYLDRINYDTFQLTPGCGYWILALNDANWNVPG